MVFLLPTGAANVQMRPEQAWVREFPNTDFATTNIDYREIVDDGNTR